MLVSSPPQANWQPANWQNNHNPSSKQFRNCTRTCVVRARMFLRRMINGFFWWLVRQSLVWWASARPMDRRRSEELILERPCLLKQCLLATSTFCTRVVRGNFILDFNKFLYRGNHNIEAVVYRRGIMGVIQQWVWSNPWQNCCNELL